MTKDQIKFFGRTFSREYEYGKEYHNQDNAWAEGTHKCPQGYTFIGLQEVASIRSCNFIPNSSCQFDSFYYRSSEVSPPPVYTERKWKAMYLRDK